MEACETNDRALCHGKHFPLTQKLWNFCNAFLVGDVVQAKHSIYRRHQLAVDVFRPADLSTAVVDVVQLEF